MTTWYDYMVRASEHAGSDGDLWFRYLYKVIKDEETKLTTDDVEQLLKNPTLTPFQKITLQDALTEGTHTREHVLQANRKSQPKDMDYDRVDKEYCARCGAELTESESYLCDFCRYDEMTS